MKLTKFEVLMLVMIVILLWLMSPNQAHAFCTYTSPTGSIVMSNVSCSPTDAQMVAEEERFKRAGDRRAWEAYVAKAMDTMRNKRAEGIVKAVILINKNAAQEAKLKFLNKSVN